jgi:hypothetical protein
MAEPTETPGTYKTPKLAKIPEVHEYVGTYENPDDTASTKCLYVYI